MDKKSSNQDLYKQLNSMLEIEDIDSSASEIHGLICARACLGDPATKIQNWLPLITGEPLAPASNKFFIEKLNQLMNDVERTLESRDYDLKLVISEEDDIATQTESIAAWCQGFVLGLLGSGEQRIEILPHDSREVVRDMIEISGAQSDADDDADQQTRALMEIEEYVRIGVQVVYEDLNADADADASKTTPERPFTA